MGKSSSKVTDIKEPLTAEDPNRSSFLTRRKPISIKRFFREDESCSNENVKKINLKSENFKDGVLAHRLIKDRERKTMQNIQKKKPPFSEIKLPHDFRNSFDIKKKL